MIKKSLLLTAFLLTAQTLFAAGSLATIKYGLTSINNDDGFDFSKHSFRVDAMFDRGYDIKPRVGLGYVSVDESKAQGGVSGTLQVDVEGVYEIESKYILTPYVFAGLGYEYVMDSRPNFDSQFFIDGGLGVRYPLQNNINLVSELKAMHMLKSNSDQDAEFAFYIGVGMPFGTISRPRDADRDGIYDYADMCPNSPMGSPVGVDGCPLQQVASYQDSDGDTVPDGKDVCPNTPMGVGVNEHGCPVRAAVQARAFNSVEPAVLGDVVTAPAVLGEVVSSSPAIGDVVSREVVSEVIDETSAVVESDGDNDGVSDVKDQCKNTPKGFTVNAIGCALKKNLNVKFNPNSSTISTTSKINIREFAQFLKRYPNAQVSVVGYTDTSGNRESNKRLSAKRAQIVKNLLIKNGVAAAKITAIGKGDLNPIATNDTAEGREKNRRIEVEIK